MNMTKVDSNSNIVKFVNYIRTAISDFLQMINDKVSKIWEKRPVSSAPQLFCNSTDWSPNAHAKNYLSRKLPLLINRAKEMLVKEFPWINSDKIEKLINAKFLKKDLLRRDGLWMSGIIRGQNVESLEAPQDAVLILGILEPIRRRIREELKKASV